MRQTVSGASHYSSSTSYRRRVMLTENTALSTGDHESPLSVCDFVRTVKSCQSDQTRTVLPNPLQTLLKLAHQADLSDFDSIPPSRLSSHMARKLGKKQEETTRSLQKIESGGCSASFKPPVLHGRLTFFAVCYALRLRLIEYADRPDILRQMAKRALDDAAAAGQDKDGERGDD
jgi:hypothetical protein